MINTELILLIDDHSIIRMALATLTKELFPNAVIHEASDGDTAFNMIKNHEYLIVIMDVNIPGTDSFSLVTKMVLERSAIKILIFSMHPEEMYANRLLKAGAMGYIQKDQPASLIKRAIWKVVNNGRYLGDAMTESLGRDILAIGSSNPFELLSPREFEILRHLIQGKGIGEISKTLSLKPSTTGTHKSRIFTKLRVKNIIEVTILAKIYDVDFGRIS